MLSESSRRQLAAAIAHHRQGRLAEARSGYEAVLRAVPDNIDSLHLFGVLSHQEGRHQAAIDLIERAIALSPRPVAELHNNLGNVLRGVGRQAAAVEHFRTAVALKPAYTEAHTNLGAVLMDLGDLAAAADSCLRAVELAPSSPAAHYALGAALQARDDLPAAADSYRRAIALKPDHVEANNNLGGVLAAMGQPLEAIAHHRRALAAKPGSANAHYNLALALQELGDGTGALASYREAQLLDPDYAEAHWNEALLRLSLGDEAGGWAKYEWRRRLPGRSDRSFDRPLWSGALARDKTILVHAEQGQGDTMQFVRYAASVKARVGTVILECQPALVGLLVRTAGIDRIVARGDPLPSFDLHVPLMSLPGLLHEAPVPGSVRLPYVHADPDQADAWRRALSVHTGLKVGMVWRGNPGNSRDRQRSVPIEIFAPLTAAQGIVGVPLQPDATSQELAALQAFGGIADHRSALTSWAETAAAISALDLVVTVDTAVAHLAGALGKPVWVLLAFTPHWCWLQGREDSPWYPTARLFRQTRIGDWPPVIARVRDALAGYEVGPPPP